MVTLGEATYHVTKERATDLANEKTMAELHRLQVALHHLLSHNSVNASRDSGEAAWLQASSHLSAT